MIESILIWIIVGVLWGILAGVYSVCREMKDIVGSLRTLDDPLSSIAESLSDLRQGLVPTEEEIQKRNLEDLEPGGPPVPRYEPEFSLQGIAISLSYLTAAIEDLKDDQPGSDDG